MVLSIFCLVGLVAAAGRLVVAVGRQVVVVGRLAREVAVGTFTLRQNITFARLATKPVVGQISS